MEKEESLMADTEKINAEALALHKKFHGKLEVRCKAPLENGHDLALAYTPGVAEPQVQGKP